MLIFTLLTTILFGESKNSYTSAPIDLKDVTTIERDMNVNEIHTYTIELNADRFLFIRIQQRGIDVLIKVFDPDDKLIDEFDGPTGTNGDEFVFLKTESSGRYSIEIHPYDPLAKSGKYILIVEKNEQVGKTLPEIIDQLFSPWDRTGTPGVAIAVVRDGKVLYTNGYGEANLEYHIPITPSTVFHMASVSKQFTAYSIAVLAEEGKLSLDDDIRKYLPEVPDFGNTITINHLIHHTSGLRDQWNLLVVAGWRLDDVITREQILRLVKNQKELNFNPGDEFLYCNTGYTLLAEIVARVSGKTFPQWTKENIFDPLGMDHTLFYDDHEKIVENRAYSYTFGDDDVYKKSVLNYANVGATSLFTTALDLAKWVINFDSPKICNQTLIDHLEEQGILNNGDTISYAFGQDVGMYKGLRLIEHNGADAGYRTYLGRFPEQKFSVIVMSNLGSFNPRRMGLQIADLYLKDLYINAESAPEPEIKIQTVEVSPTLIESYTGLYELEPGLRVHVIRGGYNLIIQIPLQGRKKLVALSETKFAAEDGSLELEFLKNATGQISKIIIRQGEDETIGRKLESFALSPEKLSEYAGNYYSEELQTSYSLAVEDSILVAHHQRHDDIVLQPQDVDVFTASNWGLGRIEFFRDTKNKIDGFRLNSGRVRNLLFIRI